MEEKKGDTRKSKVIQCLDRKNWKIFVDRAKKMFEELNNCILLLYVIFFVIRENN